MNTTAHWHEMPGVLTFLPMVYIAWSDGVLTPTELDTISVQIAAQDWVSSEEQAVLSGWLDPSVPPSPLLMHRWLSAMKEHTKGRTTTAPCSLAELGLLMAEVSGAPSYPEETVQEALAALSEVEDALGVVGAEAAREMLPDGWFPSVSDSAEEEHIPALPSFSAQELLVFLDGAYHETHQMVRALLCDPVFRYPERTDKETHRERVLGWCQELAARGLGAYAYPEEYGGGDMGKFLAAFESIALHDLSLLVKYGVQFGLWGGSVHMLGTERHHQAFLKDIGTLALPGCFAMTETGHGSNVRELETIARFIPEKDAFLLHTPTDAARKDYIGNAALHGRAATVFAQLEVAGEQHGVHAFVVDLRHSDGTLCEGVRIEDCGEKMGLNGVDNGRIWFDNVLVPRERLLDRFGQVTESGEYTSSIASATRRFFSMLGTLVGGRVSVGAASVSVSKSALAIAIRYGAKRRQFGASGAPEMVLLDYQTHQARLMPRLAKTYALHFAFRDLQAKYLERTDETMQEIEVLAAGLKSYASWHAAETIQTARECCGGQGYLAENRFAALKADSDVFSTFEGDNTVLMQLVAKGLLSKLRKEFSDMKFFGLVRYLAQQATTAIAGRNPVTIRLTDASHLRDPAFHAELLEHRLNDVLTSLAKRMKKRIDAGMDSFQAFVACQNHALDVSFAYIEHQVLLRFQEAIARCEVEHIREVLQELQVLYALDCISRDAAWFLENDYMEGNKARAIRKQMEESCVAIRERAILLVESFGIPDELLAAPIAMGE